MKEPHRRRWATKNEYMRYYYATHKEYYKNYYTKNAEKIKEYSKKYCKKQNKLIKCVNILNVKRNTQGV